MEFAELLSEEHVPIRRALAVLKIMAENAELGVAQDRHDINALLLFLHYFGDVCHQGKEESILFAALKASESTASTPAVERLLSEHHDQRLLIEATQLSLFTENRRDFSSNARKLVDVLSRHTDEEERMLFPFAEQRLPREKAAEMVIQINDADARFGRAQKELLLEMLRRLEQKYLRKA